MPYSCEAVKEDRISSSAFRQPDQKTSARISLAASSSIEGAGLVNHCSRKGSALDEGHLETAQRILEEAGLSGLMQFQRRTRSTRPSGGRRPSDPTVDEGLSL